MNTEELFYEQWATGEDDEQSASSEDVYRLADNIVDFPENSNESLEQDDETALQAATVQEDALSTSNRVYLDCAASNDGIPVECQAWME